MMDERHWWIAGKIQETFHIGGFDNPSLLEDFMVNPETLDMINQFLHPGGPCRLFLYCDRSETASASAKALHITGSLASLKEISLDDVTIQYFLRNNIDTEVDPQHMERDVYCGELKGNTIEVLNSLLSEIYVPLIKAKKEWGQCTSESQSLFMHNLDKVLSGLSESNTGSQSSKHVMLKLPENIVGSDFKQHRLAATDHTLIAEYEQVVSDWIATIEAILHDTTDERFMDPNAGPLSELDRWKRRQRLLTSITEQLKGKECKAVIGILITAKSRLLKKWKTIDSGITDAMNETKDKVRYLESLKRHLDQLYTGATPQSIMSQAIPGLLHSVKQMDSVSRFYARQGFLGLLFTKVTNQVVLACKEYVQQCTIVGDIDQLWDKVQDEIIEREGDAIDMTHRMMARHLESRLRTQQTKNKTGFFNDAETLYNRLRSVLSLQTFYRESVRSLRDALGASQNLSQFTSMSSLGQAPSQGGRSKQSGAMGLSSSRGHPKTSTSRRTTGSMISASDHEGHGVSVADEETIMWHLDAFCARIRQILDAINTLSQFTKMIKSTTGLPRPRREDLVYDEREDMKSQKEQALPAITTIQPGDGDLEAITEDEEVLIERKQEKRNKHEHGDNHELDKLMGTITKRDVELIKQYWPDNQRGEGPSVSDIVDQHVQKMTHTMTENVTTKTMLDVESKDQDRFEDIYTTFLKTVQDMERFLSAYLNATFVRKMKTNEALDMISKFMSIQQRPGIRVVISEKFIEIFNWYEGDLEEIQQIYERHKEEPPLLRNAPPVAGAINWSRQLLKRIEDPMRIFRDNKAVTNLKDFGRIVKIYNRLATALVTFESLWFTFWKQSIDHARNGLRATLFVLHPQTGDILVNADEKVLELIHEAKWLTRLGIQIPEAAQQIMSKESRFKSYKDHLELCIKQFKEVCEKIPAALKTLFQPHVQSALQNFQPGISTLAWNSMNIDAFLHQIHSGTANLKFLVERVNELMLNKVEGTITKIKNMVFFDYELAFSRSWPPQQFIDVIGNTIKSRSEQLHDYILTIEGGIKESASFLVAKKNLPPRSVSPSVGRSSRSSKHSQQSTSSKNRSRSQLNSRERTSQANIALSKEEERVAAELVAHYRDLIYEAILLATTRSLVTLAESSGCEGEVIRAASALSDAPSSHGIVHNRPRTPVSRASSRVMSAVSDRSRPVSVLSMLSNMTWSTDKAKEITYLQFEVNVRFSIPNIVIEPALDSISNALNLMARSIIQVPQESFGMPGVRWVGGDNLGDRFLASIKEDEVVDDILSQITSVVDDLQSVVKQHMFHFSMYDFLWKDDMYGNYYEFIQNEPGLVAINREVERLLKIEKKVVAIPQILPVGPICLQTSPIRDALHGFAMAWKNQYASVLHEEAKRKLDAALAYRSNVRQRLELNVMSLDQLNGTLHLLEEVRDMENKIDGQYLPIETMYAKLREFELRLPRQEVEDVDQLRDHWQELLNLAEEVRRVLLKEKRANFEQELDKQVKGFVVEVIQFRNAFDAQGPAVPGITPATAVTRLTDFQNRYSLYEAKRMTLDSVSKLFGIPCKPFPELDKTGEELELLGMLYGLFQKFLRFDEGFKGTLWAEVDLEAATREVESYWDECLALPSKLKEWDACNDMKGQIQEYRDVFPLLHKLASKEIRNRHWLQVMAVTSTTFQLEANVFRLSHLLDIGLMKHRKPIEEICWSASRELELEVKLRMTEEEWTEQVLNFENYKKRGPMYLDKSFTERLLEQLEDAQALLAQMLTSKYIGPLREEAAGWAEKLKEVSEVLETWLEVQDLWQFLEAVFSIPETAKELPQEAKRFARIDKGWSKMMKRAYDTRNVLQCCYGEEVPKGVVLRHIHQELEICFKSLVGYLDSKRRAFPRFYFVTDPILLAILSKPNDLESVKPHFRSLFGAIADLKLEKVRLSDSRSDVSDGQGRSTTSRMEKSRAGSSTPHMMDDQPTKIDKRLTEIHNLDQMKHLQGPNHFLPSEMTLEDTITFEAYSVTSAEGETLKLIEKVPLIDGVETWLRLLKESMNKSLVYLLDKLIKDINNGVSCDEWAVKYPSQLCRLGLLYIWTKECEQGITELKYDRKALTATNKRFGGITSRLPTILMRGAWRSLEEPMLPVHKLRLESMITQSLFLRDMIENLANRRLKENSDFDWRRCLRLYVHEIDEKQVPCMFMLDQKYSYGCEFYGAQLNVALTPLTDKCYLSMSQAVNNCRGAMVTGGTASGKTETVKGFAQVLGNFMVMFHCAAQSDPATLGRITQGLAMDGCWGCFDDVEQLSENAFSVLINRCQAVLGAMKEQRDYCFIGDGQEINVKTTTGMFMTHNPESRPTSVIPTEIRSLFRMVSLVKPDRTLVLKAKCASMGFKAPHILALRLKLVAELAKDLLSDNVKHNLSTAALTGVLQKAMMRKRFIREEKSMDKFEKRSIQETAEQPGSRAEGSRSDSQTSQAPSTLQVQQSMSITTAQASNPRLPMYGQKKATTPNPLSAAAKVEHSIVGACLLEIISPRLAQENISVFKSIVKDIFSGLPDALGANAAALSAHSRTHDVEMALESKARENGFVAHRPWMDKCMQLFNVSQVHQGIIVAGPPGSGKSAVIQSLVDALCVTPRGMSRASSGRTNHTGADMSETNHKLQKIYPMVSDDLSLIFGYLNNNNDWVDGIFTSAWRKATRNQSTTWLCMDGPLISSWVDHFSSVLDISKTLNIENGDQLPMSPNVKVLFETDDLSVASPAVVARTGIVFVDKNVVGWRPIAKAWLENRTQQEVHVLQRAFNKTVDVVSHFVMNECKPKLQLTEIGLFLTCLNLLSAMLSDNVEIGGELHIERLYLFCVMWSYGGLLDEKDKRGFNDLLGTLSTALPDDDRDVCFMDYYVDESGEWDPWVSRIPEAVYSDHNDLLGEVFVDTVDTIRTRLMMDFAYASGQNVLLVGPPGSGKTAIINDFIDTQNDPQGQVTKKLVYSGSSNSKQLQTFIESNIFHRQGFVYGAKEGKRLQLFIDDLNLPHHDEHGVQRCNELLRRMLDDKIICTVQKPFEWHSIEGLTVLSAMTLSEYPSVNDKVIHPRLMRHFAVFHLPGADENSLKSIVNGILEANMNAGDHPGLDIELHNGLVQASVKLMTAVKKVLRPSPMPGRHHYFFTLKEVTTCFQCVKRLPEEARGDEKMVVSLWKHEMDRLMKDTICRFNDNKWFDETMKETLNDIWPDLTDELHKYFVTFPTDAKSYMRPVTSMSKKEMKVILQPVESLKDVHNCLQTHLNRYNEEFGNVYLDINLNENMIAHIIKMHRVLSYHHGGNFMLVGPIGSHLGTLCKLALHVADIPIHPIDTKKRNTFFDGLRSAVRLTGAEGKKLTVFFTSQDLEDELYLDAINSLLVSGEYPHLFTNDELDGLLQALGPAMKREHPTMSGIDHLKFFVSRVKTNLHIMVCLPPNHKLLTVAASQYPGLLSGCQLIWMTFWTKEALLGEAAYYLNKYGVTKDCEADLTDSIVTCMANIHSYVLNDCRQTKWAGDTAEEITVTQIKPHEKKKDQMKTQQLKLPNLPYSKSILYENIKLRHHDLEIPTTSELFIGPTTYRRFMDTFRSIYTKKAMERTEKVAKLKKVISTLDHTRKDAKKMRENIKNINKEFEAAKEKTAQLMKQLTHKATVYEKLKAKYGIATSLSAFLQLNELSEEEEENDDLLKEEERDEYDDEFDRMREANLRTRQVQAQEEIKDATVVVDKWREKLTKARQQVMIWKGKVDRQCIERLKNFQNPPLLVGYMMEMVMTLIGKKSVQKSDRGGEYLGKEDQSGRYSASSSSTKFTAKKSGNKKDKRQGSSQASASSVSGRSVSSSKGHAGKPKEEKFDRAAWKSMQTTMNDATKFVDMLHNVPWEDGLPEDVVYAVENYLAKGADGTLGVTGEGTLLENAQDPDFKAKKRSQSPDSRDKGITIASAKYSSEDAATLVQYTIAIIEYTRHCGPLKAALERVHELKREIEENDRIQKEKEEQDLTTIKEEAIKAKKNKPETPEKEEEPEPEDEDLTEADLGRIQEQVDRLQAAFDIAVDGKHSLEMELTSMRERLKAATDMIESLKSQEQDWRAHVKEFGNNDILVANCIAASGFLAYCSGLNMDTRKRMGEFFMQISEHHGIPLATKKLFRNMELVDFLHTPLHVRKMEELKLPKTRLMMENSCFVTQGDDVLAWPILCDPTLRSIDWVKCWLKDKGLVVVRYADLRSQFDTCLAEGYPLLVTDIDVQQFARDVRFQRVIHSRSKFVAGRNPFKIPVGDHEVECQPHFRMYLHTTALPHQLAAGLSAYLAVIYMHMSRYDVEEEMLDRFMMLEKQRLDEERKALLQDRLENMNYLAQLEDQMLNYLSGDVRLLNDLVTTKKLAELKKQHDETEDSQYRVDMSEESIMRGREAYRPISSRGAVCFDTAQYLREVNPAYQMSFPQFLDLYDAAIAHSDRASTKTVIDRMAWSAYTSTVRMLLERDRPLYQLLLAIEIEDANENVGPGEREYLISPSLGSVTMTALGFTQPTDSRFIIAKKPFDWMQDEAYHHLQMLAIHYEWFQDMFDRMPRDGRETQWRNLCEHDHPEVQNLPDKMDDHFTALQRLLVIRAVRSDRLMQLSTLFVNNVLGKKFSGECLLDMTQLLRQSSPTVPILLMSISELESAERLVMEFAGRKQTQVLKAPLTGNRHAEEKLVRKFLSKAHSEGHWVLILNGHNNEVLLNRLDSLIAEVEGNPNPEFRIWIVAQAMPNQIPVTVLQTCQKAMIEKPRTMKENLQRCFSWMDADILRQNSRAEWAPFLHNLCYLHGAIRLRARLGRGGWNVPTDFTSIGNNEFFEALQIAIPEFKDQQFVVGQDGQPLAKSTSWAGLRYMMADVIYGNYASDSLDQQSLSAIVDFWCSPNVIKKEFEVPKVRYRCPAVFFNPNARLSQLSQAIDNVSAHQLETPEACNLHASSEALLGDDQYVFTRLNKVFDAMPTSTSLTHKLFPRAPTPFDGPPVSNISTSSNSQHVVNQGVFASASHAALKIKKESDLWEICHQMLPKVPRGYNKDYVIERLKKNTNNPNANVFSSFNLYIMKELELMYALILEIRATLQAIKSACEVNNLGDMLSPKQLASADDLYHLRIPKHWLMLAGNTAPPPSHSLSAWMTDLQNRSQHFERILALGKEKMPAYWLGAFFYPRGLLALLKQECYKHHANDRSGNFDQYVFQTEITARDKDHIRDPPAEGMFIFGIYLWGCAWEKTNGELLDQPPRSTCASMPVIHITTWPQSEKPLLQDATRASELYACPVYHTRSAPRESVLELDLYHVGVPSTRWALRGLTATIRPY